MIKLIVGIEGMACGMCEAHINEAVRNAFQVKKVTSSHTKKQTVIIAEKDITEQDLKDVIAKTGYEVIAISSEPYEKKGLFSAFRG
ncbi:MAG: heavy-metal-associated domain-containing protein [Lachnospiraceae bacterium]|nr:heavy-metal-associated domain-containing protein [Lachnospiraceae bacterium]